MSEPETVEFYRNWVRGLLRGTADAFEGRSLRHTLMAQWCKTEGEASEERAFSRAYTEARDFVRKLVTQLGPDEKEPNE